MRQIGHLESEAAARRFSDFLVSRDIANRVEAEGQQWAVWVHEEDQRAAASEELERFRTAPDDPAYAIAAREAAAKRKAAQGREREYRKNYRPAQQDWQSSGRIARRPVTTGLIALAIAAVFYTSMGQDRGAADHLFIESVAGQLMTELGAGSGLNAVRAGQIWRLLTPIFLHFSWPHLIFNCWWTWDLGGQIEARRGSWRFALLVLLIAVTSNLGEYFYSGLGSGLSGVVYGLFGYVLIKAFYDPQSTYFLSPPAVVIVLGWFALCWTGMLSNVVGGDVANMAHTIGLAAGCLAAAIPLVPKWLGQQSK